MIAHDAMHWSNVIALLGFFAMVAGVLIAAMITDSKNRDKRAEPEQRHEWLSEKTSWEYPE